MLFILSCISLQCFFSLCLLYHISVLCEDAICSPPLSVYLHTQLLVQIFRYIRCFMLHFSFFQNHVRYSVFFTECVLCATCTIAHTKPCDHPRFPHICFVFLSLYAFYAHLIRSFWQYFHFSDFHTGKLPVDIPIPARYNKHINSTEHTNAQC